MANSPGNGYGRRDLMSASTSARDRARDARSAGMGWGGALLGGLAVLAVSFLGFAYAPNLLINHLFARTAPRTRDPLILLWVAIVFVVDSWLFVRLQRLGGRGEVRG